MSSANPARSTDSLADVVEMLLDKGIVVNADIIVTIGETELLGIHLRAAIASFETAAQYGLEFPDGTDTGRIDELTGRERHLETLRATGGDPDIVDEADETATWTVRPPVAVPTEGGEESTVDAEDESDVEEMTEESATESESTEEAERDDASTEEADGGD